MVLTALACEPSCVGQLPGTASSLAAILKFGSCWRIAFIRTIPFCPAEMLPQSALETIERAIAGASARPVVTGVRNGPSYVAPTLAVACLSSASGTVVSAPVFAWTSAIRLQPFTVARYPNAEPLKTGAGGVKGHAFGEIMSPGPYCTRPISGMPAALMAGQMLALTRVNTPSRATTWSWTASFAHAVATLGSVWSSQPMTLIGCPLMPPLAFCSAAWMRTAS